MLRIVLLVQLLATVGAARYFTYGYGGDIFFTYVNPVEKQGVQVVYRPKWIMDFESQNRTQFWGCLRLMIKVSDILIQDTTQNLYWSTEGEYFYTSRIRPDLTAGEWINYQGEIYDKTHISQRRCLVRRFYGHAFDDFSGAYEVPKHVEHCELEIVEWNYTAYPEATKCSTVMNGSLPEYSFNISNFVDPGITEGPVIVAVLVPVAITGIIVLCLLLVIFGQRIHFRYRRNLSLNRRLPTQQTDNALPLPINSNYGLPVYEDLPDADLPPGYEEASMLPAVTSEAESKV